MGSQKQAQDEYKHPDCCLCPHHHQAQSSARSEDPGPYPTSLQLESPTINVTASSREAATPIAGNVQQGGYSKEETCHVWVSTHTSSQAAHFPQTSHLEDPMIVTRAPPGQPATTLIEDTQPYHRSRGPKCYPGTHIRLTTKIWEWFLHDVRNCNFLWLSGPTGVGKSAVAQSTAKFAIGEGILGAVYFFSRPNKQHKYMEVFITLAYQLTICFPGYQPLITAKLAAEPDLLEKTPHVQFKKLIVEPLLLLSHERKCVIILDGLDECKGESNQLEIIELINNLHSNTSLPIIWMICS
ncbi:hypothetical protein P691DRAFT_767386 [Macrolepiota fuliginosa MF-IS2]|uniref:Nephrocystin 3-like N-terminal domain-containing protein n=1 Tax=Macrolepiota fuliginosa MF-IS2 TaxID=1400762 RepID=A0A9P5WYI4_9AGAR|nr:hypothetical protein P691DRAFT_767386 [Macrolepiota fuliginosa MF-IS2]